MINLFEETRKNISEIKRLVDSNSIDTEKYPLDSFVYNKGFVEDLLTELDDCVNIKH